MVALGKHQRGHNGDVVTPREILSLYQDSFVDIEGRWNKKL